MPSPVVTSFSNATVGNVSLSVPFNPSYIEFHISAKNNSENDFAHYSRGHTDGTNHAAITSMVVGSLPITRRSTDYCLTHYGLDASMATKRIISATLVSKTSTVLTLNFDRADINYPIDMVVWP